LKNLWQEFALSVNAKEFGQRTEEQDKAASSDMAYWFLTFIAVSVYM